MKPLWLLTLFAVMPVTARAAGCGTKADCVAQAKQALAVWTNVGQRDERSNAMQDYTFALGQLQVLGAADEYNSALKNGRNAGIEGLQKFDEMPATKPGGATGTADQTRTDSNINIPSPRNDGSGVPGGTRMGIGAMDFGRKLGSGGMGPDSENPDRIPSDSNAPGAVTPIAARETQALNNGNPKQINDIASERLKNNQPKEALKDYTQVIDRDPKNTDARQGRIQARLASGDEKGAREDAKALLALDPKNQLAQLVVGHGDSISQGGSHMKMKADFGAAKDPDLSATTPAAASAGSFSPAVRGAAPSVPAAGGIPTTQHGASPVQILLAQSEESLRMRDFTRAVLSARQAADLAPMSAATWSMLAEVSNEAGNPTGALQAAKTALALEPANPQALRAKAYAEFLLGNFRAAYEDALSATQADPKNGLGFMYLAMAEEKLGRPADALKHYETAMSLDTTLAPLVEDALTRLRGGSASKSLGDAVKRRLVRGGALTISLALVLLGLLGTAAGKVLTTRGAKPAAEPAAALQTAPEVGAGTLLGGAYRVTGELGRGGMGVVYRAMDEHLQRPVAIKRLQRTPETTSADLERLLKEARVVASLKHPSIAEIYTVINEGDLFLVFELVDGEPLDKVLSRGGTVPAAQVRRMISEIGAALECAHARKIIHRDLKPSNIMVAKDGSVKVMDFGIAHQSREGKGMTMTAASGTPPYMAPEQSLGSVSKAADYYALGVMAYELLTGRRPFDGPDYLEQKLQKRFPPASQRNSNLRRSLDAFFDRALDPDPTKRPSDAQAFLAAFDQASSA